MKGIGLGMGNGIFPPFIPELYEYIALHVRFCYPFSPYFPQLVLPPTHSHTHTQYGYTALMAAAESQHEDVVELLTEAHADPDLQDEVIGIMFAWIQHMESP